MRITMKLQHASGPTGEAQWGLHEYDEMRGACVLARQCHFCRILLEGNRSVVSRARLHEEMPFL